MAENAAGIDYTDTGSLKRVRWQSNCPSRNRSTTCYGCENRLEFDTGVAWASLQITTIDRQVAHTSRMQRSLATLHNTGYMDHRQGWHGKFSTNLELGLVDVKEAYRYSPSQYHCHQCHVWSYGWHFVSFRYEEDSTEVKPLLHPEVCATEVVTILSCIYPNDGYASHFSTDPRSFLQVAII